MPVSSLAHDQLNEVEGHTDSIGAIHAKINQSVYQQPGEQMEADLSV
jgi:hypothetical protein